MSDATPTPTTETRALLAANHAPRQDLAEGQTVITLASATQAFKAWEEAYRAEPAQFLTADEVAQLEVADVCTARAIYFMALLRQGGGE